MTNAYDSSSIKTLSFGRSVREKLGMYLSADIDTALVLGVRELIYNVTDEFEMGFGTYIILEINTKTNIITCTDDARGVPVGTREDGTNSLVAAFTLPHSGAKHDTEVYSGAVGINGIGAKVVCHTSEWMEVKVARDGNYYNIRFEESEEGAIAGPIRISKNNDFNHGTIISYKPSKLIYGDNRINIEEIRTTLRELSYFTKGMKFDLIVDGKKETFLSKNGLSDALASREKVHKNILYYNNTLNDVKVELALQWCKQGAVVKNFANNLEVPDGGAFITGFKTSLTKAFNNVTGKEYSGEIIRKYLDGYISVKVRVPQFSNQSKTSLANPEARTAASGAITEAFKDFANKYASDVEKIIDLMDNEQKAENAAKRAREAEKQIVGGQKKAKMLTSLPAKLADANGNGYKELFIVEGKQNCPIILYR